MHSGCWMAGHSLERTNPGFSGRTQGAASGGASPPSPGPTGLLLASDSGSCIWGELIPPLWTTASSPHSFLAPFCKTSLQREEGIDPTGKSHWEQLLRTGSARPLSWA